MRFLPFAAAVSLFSSPVMAAADPAQPAAVPKPVCESIMHTGTRFKTKVCRTQAQWDQLTEQSRRNAADMLNRPAINTERGN